MTKSKLQIRIINVETGEEIVRDATAEEIAQMEIDANIEMEKSKSSGAVSGTILGIGLKLATGGLF